MTNKLISVYTRPGNTKYPSTAITVSFDNPCIVSATFKQGMSLQEVKDKLQGMVDTLNTKIKQEITENGQS